jgi:DNA-binding IclR family transcriptional regulator
MGRRKMVVQRQRIVARPEYAHRTVKSAARVMQILEFFDDIKRQATVMEVAETLGYPQSSTSALLRSLVVLGYLLYDPYTRVYVPSSRVALLGSWVSGQFVAEGKILRMMKELNERTGDVVMLAVRNGLHAQYIHVLQATNPARLHMTLGTVRSLAHSGAGYAILSTMSDAEVTRVVMRINAEKGAEQPLNNIRELLANLAEIRRVGYAFTTDLVTRGGGILAKPLPEIPNQPLMVVGIGGISEVMRQRREELTETFLDVYRRYFGPNPIVDAAPSPTAAMATGKVLSLR